MGWFDSSLKELRRAENLVPELRRNLIKAVEERIDDSQAEIQELEALLIELKIEKKVNGE